MIKAGAGGGGADQSLARGGRRKRQGQVQVAHHDVGQHREGQPRLGGEQPPRAAGYLDGVSSVEARPEARASKPSGRRNGRDRPAF